MIRHRLRTGRWQIFFPGVYAPHGLPPVERQVPTDGPQAVADGRSRRLDFRDGRRGLALEVDGDLFHSTRQRQDRGRDRRAAGRGEVTIRAGWVEVVVHPCELAADVAAAPAGTRMGGAASRLRPGVSTLR